MRLAILTNTGSYESFRTCPGVSRFSSATSTSSVKLNQLTTHHRNQRAVRWMSILHHGSDRLVGTNLPHRLRINDSLIASSICESNTSDQLKCCDQRRPHEEDQRISLRNGNRNRSDAGSSSLVGNHSLTESSQGNLICRNLIRLPVDQHVSPDHHERPESKSSCVERTDKNCSVRSDRLLSRKNQQPDVLTLGRSDDCGHSMKSSH